MSGAAARTSCTTRARPRGDAPPRGSSPPTRTLRTGWSTACGICSARCAVPGRWSPPGSLSVTRRRALAARLPTCVLGNVRSVRLVDELDAVEHAGRAVGGAQP